jgi:hypothetical protein
MRDRKLRIAWSVAWGLVAVLLCVLCVLWARSYWWRESLVGNLSPYVPLLSLSSDAGQLKYADVRRDGISPSEFAIISRRAEESLKIVGAFDSRLVAGFGIRLARDSWAMAAPHWFPAVVFAALAALPWIRWRFRLRTLLIATTLVAVVLGLIGYALKK